MSPKTSIVRIAFASILLLGAAAAFGKPSRSEIDRDSSAALQQLYAKTPGARALAEKAKAILIFPSVKKAGFLVGGQFGDGVLRQGGKAKGYYRSVAGSYGLQAGAQKFSYVLMFMDNKSLAYLDKSEGWELGVGPSLVVVDEGMAKSLTSTTLREGVYAFIFGQKGLMGGLGVQGSKITKVDTEP